MNVTNCDVLIVGAGIAGLRAALQATERGRSTIVLSKVHPALTHSTMPEGGINLSTEGDSSWRQQAQDIWNDGHFLSDWDAVEAGCRDGSRIVLEEYPDILERDERGQIVANDFAGTRWIKKAGPNSGLNFVRRLSSKVAEREVSILADRVALSLIVDSGRCVGLTAFNVLTGQVEGYAASNVVLCTGGYGYMYLHSVHGPSMSGDGQALAYRAGVPLKDLEFVRFHHTVVYGARYAITEGAFRKGMRLYNQDGERFVARYDSRMEETELFYLKRYMQLEIDAGRGVEGRYLLADFTHLDEASVNEALPRTRRGCLEALGLDILKDRIPVVPGVYATLGGIDIDVDGRTSLPGLFAGGECACPGLHGADWRVGNTLLAALVFGTRAGASAAAAAPGPAPDLTVVATAVREQADRLREIIERPHGEPHEHLRGALRNVLSRDVGVARDRPRLEQALTTILDLRKRYEGSAVLDRGLHYNGELISFLELDNQLLVAELVTRAALARTESRGCHWRTDFPERDDATFQAHSLQRQGSSGPELTYVPVRLGEFETREAVLIR